MVRPGDLIAERFEIVAEVASGGMGTILRARDRTGGGMVAVKLLNGGDRGDRARFEREAQVLAGLGHPGIVRYIAHGRTADGRPYLVEDWIEGESLADRLERTGLTVREAVAVLGRIAEAVAAAHAAGVVHRDLKPDNILLSGDGLDQVTLVDFGLARPLRDGRRLTGTGMVMGTPGYLAPEQARGSKDVGPPADVFALGCILFECLTGRAAFAGQDARAIMAKVIMLQVPAPSALAPEVPPELDALVVAMLDKRAEARPAGATEVARALAALPVRVAGPRRPAGEPAMPTMRLPAPAPGRPGDEASPPAGALAVVLAVPPGGAEPGPDLADELAVPGGRLLRLDDGSLLVAVDGNDDVGVAATRAADVALRLRLVAGSGPIAVASVQAGESRASIDRLIDRCARQLETTEAGAIGLDGATAGRLDSSFDVACSPSGFRLRGRR